MKTKLYRSVAALWLVALVAPLGAQPAMSGFEPIDKFVFSVGGVDDKEAEVFQSQAVGAYLVVSKLVESPILIEARSAEVSAVDLMKVDRQDDGGVALLADAGRDSMGKFTIAGDGITFGVGGKTAELRNKPWLLGEQDLAAMRAYSRDYRAGAESYQTSEPLLHQLEAESRPVEIRVFFGSWCPHCQQVLPRVLRVAQELQGSKVRLSFYGLPRGPGFATDPEVKRFGIDSVPTGVVFIDGREVGRISGESWKIPELAIKNAIQGS